MSTQRNGAAKPGAEPGPEAPTLDARCMCAESDLGNAQRFALTWADCEWGGSVRYAPDEGWSRESDDGWFRLNPDALMRLARLTALRILDEGDQLSDLATWTFHNATKGHRHATLMHAATARYAWGHSSRSPARLEAMLELAKVDPRIAGTT